MEKAYLVDFYANRIKITSEKNIETILADAQWFLNRATNRKKLRGISNFLSAIWNLKHVHNRRYFSKTIFLDGNPCTTPDQLKMLIRQLQLVLKFKAMEAVWKVEIMEFGSTVEKYRFIESLTQYAKEALLAYEKGVLALDHLKEEQGLSGDLDFLLMH